MNDVGVLPPRPRPATDADADTERFRGRLLKGLQRAIEERGYRDTTIADIVRHARASRRTFYRVFATKDDCLLALMEAGNAALIQRLTDAVDPLAPWPAQARQAVQAYIEHVASSPALSLCWIRELPSLGPVAERVKRESMNALADLVQRLSDNEPFRRDGRQPVSRELALLILGGLRELTATVLEAGGDVRDVLEVAVAATVAVLGTSPPIEPAPTHRPASAPSTVARDTDAGGQAIAAPVRPPVLTDEQWARVAPLLPPAKGAVGRPQVPHRQVVEAILYRDRMGIPWRYLPAGFGPWQTAWKRHRRWSGDGTWGRVLKELETHASSRR